MKVTESKLFRATAALAAVKAYEEYIKEGFTEREATDHMTAFIAGVDAGGEIAQEILEKEKETK